ncbi:MAG: sulfoxide reductase heme-binding subunit YedZ [Rhodocyclaceae bacterium]|nr:sulfoxide reductase heme-binding subunit YedZ [Rhodocyclaceae bacterium]
MPQPSPRQLALIKTSLFLLCLLPMVRLAVGVYEDSLGANPIELITRDLGTWALNFLLIALTITPLRKATGWHWLVRLRRMLGLYAFFYALLHLSSYLWLDQFFDWGEILKDIIKRPFITVGMLTFLLLVPLALTSNNLAIRRLGGKRWQQLHQLIYPLTICAVLHYWWLIKLDVMLPGIYAGLLAALLMVRVRDGWQKLRQRY